MKLNKGNKRPILQEIAVHKPHRLATGVVKEILVVEQQELAVCDVNIEPTQRAESMKSITKL